MVYNSDYEMPCYAKSVGAPMLQEPEAFRAQHCGQADRRPRGKTYVYLLLVLHGCDQYAVNFQIDSQSL